MASIEMALQLGLRYSCKFLTRIQNNGNLSIKILFKNMLIYVTNNWLASYLVEHFLLREPTQQFFHDVFTMGSNGEKKWGDSFCVQCVYESN